MILSDKAIAEFKKILEESIGSLFKNQPNLSKFTSETNQHEVNLCHHLANEISKFLDGYDCDLDIIKRNLENKRPDIIFHKRDNHDDNLLVIEVKRSESHEGTEDDIKKIKEYWMQEPLSYKFGASIVLDISKREAQGVIFSDNENLDLKVAL